MMGDPNDMLMKKQLDNGTLFQNKPKDVSDIETPVMSHLKELVLSQESSSMEDKRLYEERILQRQDLIAGRLRTQRRESEFGFNFASRQLVDSREKVFALPQEPELTEKQKKDLIKLKRTKLEAALKVNRNGTEHSLDIIESEKKRIQQESIIEDFKKDIYDRAQHENAEEALKDKAIIEAASVFAPKKELGLKGKERKKSQNGFSEYMNGVLSDKESFVSDMKKKMFSESVNPEMFNGEYLGNHFDELRDQVERLKAYSTLFDPRTELFNELNIEEQTQATYMRELYLCAREALVEGAKLHGVNILDDREAQLNAERDIPSHQNAVQALKDLINKDKQTISEELFDKKIRELSEQGNRQSKTAMSKKALKDEGKEERYAFINLEFTEAVQYDMLFETIERIDVLSKENPDKYALNKDDIEQLMKEIIHGNEVLSELSMRNYLAGLAANSPDGKQDDYVLKKRAEINDRIKRITDNINCLREGMEYLAGGEEPSEMACRILKTLGIPVPEYEATMEQKKEAAGYYVNYMKKGKSFFDRKLSEIRSEQDKPLFGEKPDNPLFDEEPVAVFKHSLNEESNTEYVNKVMRYITLYYNLNLKKKEIETGFPSAYEADIAQAEYYHILTEMQKEQTDILTLNINEIKKFDETRLVDGSPDFLTAHQGEIIRMAQAAEIVKALGYDANGNTSVIDEVVGSKQIDLRKEDINKIDPGSIETATDRLIFDSKIEVLRGGALKARAAALLKLQEADGFDLSCFDELEQQTYKDDQEKLKYVKAMYSRGAYMVEEQQKSLFGNKVCELERSLIVEEKTDQSIRKTRKFTSSLSELKKEFRNVRDYSAGYEETEKQIFDIERQIKTLGDENREEKEQLEEKRKELKERAENIQILYGLCVRPMAMAGDEEKGNVLFKDPAAMDDCGIFDSLNDEEFRNLLLDLSEGAFLSSLYLEKQKNNEEIEEEMKKEVSLAANINKKGLNKYFELMSAKYEQITEKFDFENPDLINVMRNRHELFALTDRTREDEEFKEKYFAKVFDMTDVSNKREEAVISYGIGLSDTLRQLVVMKDDSDGAIDRACRFVKEKQDKKAVLKSIGKTWQDAKDPEEKLAPETIRLYMNALKQEREEEKYDRNSVREIVSNETEMSTEEMQAYDQRLKEKQMAVVDKLRERKQTIQSLMTKPENVETKRERKREKNRVIPQTSELSEKKKKDIIKERKKKLAAGQKISKNATEFSLDIVDFEKRAKEQNNAKQKALKNYWDKTDKNPGEDYKKRINYKTDYASSYMKYEYPVAHVNNDDPESPIMLENRARAQEQAEMLFREVNTDPMIYSRYYITTHFEEMSNYIKDLDEICHAYNGGLDQYLVNPKLKAKRAELTELVRNAKEILITIPEQSSEATETVERVELTMALAPEVKTDRRGNVTRESQAEFDRYMSVVSDKQTFLEEVKKRMIGENINPDMYTKDYIGAHYDEIKTQIQRIKAYIDFFETDARESLSLDEEAYLEYLRDVSEIAKETLRCGATLHGVTVTEGDAAISAEPELTEHEASLNKLKDAVLNKDRITEEKANAIIDNEAKGLEDSYTEEKKERLSKEKETLQYRDYSFINMDLADTAQYRMIDDAAYKADRMIKQNPQRYEANKASIELVMSELVKSVSAQSRYYVRVYSFEQILNKEKNKNADSGEKIRDIAGKQMKRVNDELQRQIDYSKLLIEGLSYLAGGAQIGDSVCHVLKSLNVPVPEFDEMLEKEKADLQTEERLKEQQKELFAAILEKNGIDPEEELLQKSPLSKLYLAVEKEDEGLNDMIAEYIKSSLELNALMSQLKDREPSEEEKETLKKAKERMLSAQEGVFSVTAAEVKEFDGSWILSGDPTCMCEHSKEMIRISQIADVVKELGNEEIEDNVTLVDKIIGVSKLGTDKSEETVIRTADRVKMDALLRSIENGVMKTRGALLLRVCASDKLDKSCFDSEKDKSFLDGDPGEEEMFEYAKNLYSRAMENIKQEEEQFVRNPVIRLEREKYHERAVKNLRAVRPYTTHIMELKERFYAGNGSPGSSDGNDAENKLLSIKEEYRKAQEKAAKLKADLNNGDADNQEELRKELNDTYREMEDMEVIFGFSEHYSFAMDMVEATGRSAHKYEVDKMKSSFFRELGLIETNGTLDSLDEEEYRKILVDLTAGSLRREVNEGILDGEWESEEQKEIMEDCQKRNENAMRKYMVLAAERYKKICERFKNGRPDLIYLYNKEYDIKKESGMAQEDDMVVRKYFDRLFDMSKEENRLMKAYLRYGTAICATNVPYIDIIPVMIDNMSLEFALEGQGSILRDAQDSLNVINSYKGEAREDEPEEPDEKLVQLMKEVTNKTSGKEEEK